LLDDHVGLIVLSAGVGNDVVGWVSISSQYLLHLVDDSVVQILLALAVALTNASSGLTALWILLAGIAFVLFMLFPVRMAFVWLARRTGSLENGNPTPFMMTITLLVILIAAFFTDVIGKLMGLFAYHWSNSLSRNPPNFWRFYRRIDCSA